MTARTDNPSAEVRIRVMKRDRFLCTYCGASGNDSELEIDHIIAVANGGSNHISNLTTACRVCNQKKSDGHRKPNPKFQVNKIANPLVDMFFHTLNESGEIQYQGYIVGVDGDVVLGQLFSWLHGGPTIVQKFNKDEMYSSRTVLYSSQEAWNSAADEQTMKRNSTSARRAEPAGRRSTAI